MSDFGLSDFVCAGNSNSHPESGGDPLFFAPEIFQDEDNGVDRHIGKPADIYSFAMFCIEYYSAERPWHAELKAANRNFSGAERWIGEGLKRVYDRVDLTTLLLNESWWTPCGPLYRDAGTRNRTDALQWKFYCRCYIVLHFNTLVSIVH